MKREKMKCREETTWIYREKLERIDRDREYRLLTSLMRKLYT